MGKPSCIRVFLVVRPESAVAFFHQKVCDNTRAYRMTSKVIEKTEDTTMTTAM